MTMAYSLFKSTTKSHGRRLKQYSRLLLKIRLARQDHRRQRRHSRRFRSQYLKHSRRQKGFSSSRLSVRKRFAVPHS